jgi:hypothetical protein
MAIQRCLSSTQSAISKVDHNTDMTAFVTRMWHNHHITCPEYTFVLAIVWDALPFIGLA